MADQQGALAEHDRRLGADIEREARKEVERLRSAIEGAVRGLRRALAQ